MTETTKCSYQDCRREAWRPTEGENPFCIFHSPKIKEKRKEFASAWDAFLAEHRNDKGHFNDLFCIGFLFPDDIYFKGATFSGKADFWGATFSKNAYFRRTTFSGDAGFWGSKFSGYAYFKGATFSGNTGFWGAVFNEKGFFDGADFTRADISYGSFTNCSFSNVKYTLHSKLSFQKPSKWYKFKEMLKVIPPTNFTVIETSSILAASNRRFVRDIEDQQYINQQKERSKFNRYFWIPVWYMTCDCGRSFSLFFLWCMLVAAFFGDVYLWFAEAWFPEPWKWSAITPFYYSLVTFSTLGFGDVTPRLTSGWAQFTVMVEVFIGYLGLGGLISIFANKLARRA